MKNILISAYALAPNTGSEYGVGWNFVTKLSKKYKVTVLYGTSGGKIGDNTFLRNYLLNNKIDNIEFIFIDTNFLISFFDFLNHRISAIFFAFASDLWHKKAYLYVKKNLNKDFILCHHINPIGFRQPGYLWKLDIPFYWGPVGGTSNLNKIFFKDLHFSNKIKHIVRNVTNIFLLQKSSKLKKVAHKSQCVFYSTYTDLQNLSKLKVNEKCYLRENSIHNIIPEVKKLNNKIQLVWIGRIDELKGIRYLLNAIKFLLDKKFDNFYLNIVGDGPLKNEMFDFADTLKIQANIKWHGKVSQNEVFDIIKPSDLLIHTSFLDSNPTVIYECLENLVPFISFDLYGMKDLINMEVGFGIDINQKSNIQDVFNEKLFNILSSPVLIKHKIDNIKKNHKILSWEHSINSVLSMYEKI